jgi:hypothetical protein
VRDAVARVLDDGHRTADLVLGGDTRDVLGCRAMGDRVLAALGSP